MDKIDKTYRMMTSFSVAALCIIIIYLSFRINKIEKALMDVIEIELMESENTSVMDTCTVAIDDSISQGVSYHNSIDREIVGSLIGTNFDYAHSKFKIFNGDIDTLTTKFFVGVMGVYDLDKSDYHRQMYVGQILLESGAKQYRSNGKLMVSSGGAIGFTQIIPSTCQWTLERYADSSDVALMRSLGASDFSFVFDNTISTSKRVSMSKTWLSNVTNNIVMWGFLTNHTLEDKGSVDVQLVSYNMGNGGCREYMNSGGVCSDHHYIKEILNALDYVKSHS